MSHDTHASGQFANASNVRAEEHHAGTAYRREQERTLVNGGTYGSLEMDLSGDAATGDPNEYS